MSPSLRQTCVNCGQLGPRSSSSTDSSSDDNEEERSEFSDSDISTTSTDITVRLTRNFSHQNFLKVTLQLRLRERLNLQKHFRGLREKQELCNTPDLFQVSHRDLRLESTPN